MATRIDFTSRGVRLAVAIALMVAAMQLVSLSDAVAQVLTTRSGLSVWQTAFGRSVFQLLFLLMGTVFVRNLWTEVRVTHRQWRIHVVRGVVSAGSSLLFFVALAAGNPQPTALTAFFVAPLAAVLFAGWLLKERITWQRLAVVTLGFGGVLLVLRPGTSDFQWTLVAATGAGITYALFLVLARTMRGNLLVATSYMTVATVVVLALGLPWFWSPIGWSELLLMLAMGGISAIGHYLISLAFHLGDASTVASFNYSELAGATLYSFLFFGLLPTALVWVGAGLIIATGIYLVWSAPSRRGALSPFRSK